VIPTAFISILILLFLIGVPAALALGTTSLIMMVIQRGFDNIPYAMVAQRLFAGVNTFPLLAIPCFLLAAKIMNVGGVTKRIFGFAQRAVGFLPGGLGQVNIFASILFAGKSGSAVADAMGLGTVVMKAMTEAGYPKRFSAAVTASSSTIAPLIPPSIPLVIYGVLANVSITGLFIAGLLPGLVMAFCLMVFCGIQSYRAGFPLEARPSFLELLSSFRSAFLPLLAPAILIWGLWSGIFTPTEASAVVVVYALILAMLIYREMSLKDLYRICAETMRDSAMILFIIAAANLYAWLVAHARIPQAVLETFTVLTADPLLTLLILNVFLLVVGLFMEANAAIVVLVPILLPVITAVGIDPIHFGIVMVLNLMIGLLTPPLGIVMYAVAKVAEIDISEMISGLIPYYIPLLVALLLVTIFPQIALFLPTLLR